MNTPYLIFKWLHIFFVIVAVGSNLTYAVWLGRVASNSSSLLFTLKTVKFIDDRLANPAYILALIMGIIMIISGNLDILANHWLVVGICLFIILAGLGFGGYSTTLRHQIRYAETDGLDSAGYKRMAIRGTIIGVILGLTAIAIIFMMTVKPQF